MMGMRKIATTTGALAPVVALAVIAIVAVAPAGAQDDSSSGGEHTLKIGWAPTRTAQPLRRARSRASPSGP